MMHDITERRAAEEQLRHSEDQFRRVWEGTPEAMRLSDPEGIVLRVNEAYCRLARKARTELENRPFWIWRSPDERPASIENYRRRDVIGWPEREERQLKTWDGRTVWAELWHAEIESPPGKRAILTAFRDVTAQRLAERALTLSERRFQELMESVSLAGALTDSEGRLTFCNSFLLNLTGYTIEDALGQPIEKFVFPEDLPKVLFAKKSALQDETPRVRAECRVLTKVGQLRTIDWSTSAYRNAEGKLVGIALLGADVTEQREMEERQRQSQRLESLGRLAGGIAHDFNNLLTVINGYADMALANLDARDPLFPLLQEICNAGERGAELTQQLLAFGRKQILRSQILDLNRVVQEAERMLRRIIGDDIQLECRLARDLRLVQADPGQIHQVILNLAVNSRDAMANGGRLVISTRDVSIPPGVFGDTEAGEYVALEFEDTGTGMTPEVRDRMFEPFFTTKEAGGGTGLGLAMVYGIVKQSEGQIEVITDIGKGTLIRVLLPAREGVAEKTEEEEAHADLEGSETILLVEDNDEVRQYMTIALKEFGYRVISAGTPAEALLLASTFRGPIDLLLTDVVMPGLKGPELAAKFRDLHPEAKVLYVSGNTEGVFNVEESKEVTLLPKPFGPAVLGQTIRDLLGKPKVRRTVLVVDDEAETRQFFARVLQQAGFEVRQAENGRSALQQMNQSAVDVVVTDLVMPEQEGLETIREIRLQHPAVPVVAVSGAFAAQYLRMARVLGATAALPKPVKAEDLVQVVTKLAETRS
jgi:PAS domain S-box-containing protein